MFFSNFINLDMLKHTNKDLEIEKVIYALFTKVFYILSFYKYARFNKLKT
jgi:hypothetical protein